MSAGRDSDVVILGGGMVGAALAAALGQEGFRVQVLDTREQPPMWRPEPFDIRVSAITRASENILRRIGAWSGVKARRLYPYQEMQVWDQGGNGSIHFDCATLAEPCLGHIIENSVMTTALWQRLGELETVELLWPARARELEIDADRVTVTLEDGRRLRATLVVGADGGRSWLRRTLGIETVGWSYQQSALVATVSTEQTHRETAWQRFLADGPLAFLPVSPEHCSIVWSTTPAQARQLAQAPEADFNDAVTEAFEGRLGAVRLHGPRGVFPLHLQHARHYVDHRVALVGDAAHSIHPLAGQGANLGYADAASLAQVLVQARGRGQDPGARAVLRRYERWRKGQNLLTMGVMDGFWRLFGSRRPGWVGLRNLGLGLADRSGPLKAMIGRHAMGLDGDLPELARPGARWGGE